MSTSDAGTIRGKLRVATEAAFSMDDLLREFLTETKESLERVDAELVRFEREPNNANILANIFRLVHTIKGTCGFLALPRLEALAHAAETLMGKFRDGMPVTAEAVTLILATIDRIRMILDEIEKREKEPEGGDGELIKRLGRMTEEVKPEPQPAADEIAEEVEPREETDKASSPKADDERSERITGHSIRVSVGTLDHLMTTVSELVLTRNQLLEIARRQEDSDFKVSLQRLSNVTAELQEGVMKTRMQPIGNAWQKLPRIVRDLCAELGKDIELKMHGAETELDRQVLELVRVSALPPASPPRGRSGLSPATRAVTSSSRLPTTATVSTLLVFAPRRSRRGSPARRKSPPSRMPKSTISSSRRASPPPLG
jgi:two-component system, chemotaxis family, sensor kinase CheA